MQNNMKTSEQCKGQNQLILFQEDSRVKTLALQHQKTTQELTETKVDFGDICSEYAVKLDQGTLYSKTLIQSLNTDLKLSSKSLQKSGMMRNGKLYKASNLAYHNGDVEFMLYSTPLASETGWRKKKFSQGGTSLSTQLGGIPSLKFMEWLMSFPIGWISTEH